LPNNLTQGLGNAAAGDALFMTASNLDSISLSSSEHQVQLRRAVIASTIGTAIERDQQ
jgi:hypothetical protein